MYATAQIKDSGLSSRRMQKELSLSLCHPIYIRVGREKMLGMHIHDAQYAVLGLCMITAEGHESCTRVSWRRVPQLVLWAVLEERRVRGLCVLDALI